MKSAAAIVQRLARRTRKRLRRLRRLRRVVAFLARKQRWWRWRRLLLAAAFAHARRWRLAWAVLRFGK
ncbi:MAG: hypothetical protein HYV63_31710 [Candidatus Schekmanbacteria bacterium]|nr:hypothetical protein [Candidatus Schekmanbacteria bacterium]